MSDYAHKPLTENLYTISSDMSNMIKEDKIDVQRLTQMLHFLKANKDNVAFDDLQRTGVGRKLNSLRRFLTNDQQLGQCKAILKVWKKVVENRSRQDSSALTSPSAKRKQSDSNSQGAGSMCDASEGSPPIKRASSDAKEVVSPFAPTGELSRLAMERLANEGMEGCDLRDVPVRLKAREMFTRALGAGGMEERYLDIAINIENIIYSDHRDTCCTKYRSQIRSRIYNLKDKKNPNLKMRVCSGEICAARFARMTAVEMASDEMKRTRQQMTKEAIDEHQMALSGGTVSDLLRCGKCKKNNCTYNQVQTRSADEPMTTFALCNECGHRWKFG